MFIRELAEKTGLTPHAIRFYEKEGLLNKSSIQRGENNYRHYDEDVIDRITLIKFAQTAGFTLSEIKELMEVTDARKLTPNEQAIILQQKVAEIDQKMAELQQVKRLLKAKLDIIYTEQQISSVEKM